MKPLWIRFQKQWKIILFCFALSALFLLICTKASFLYPINDWNDSNCFFTVGKGMMQGKVPYRDLFEQKGPLLYFIHGLASLISFDSFFGVFFFEILSFGIFLWFSYRIILLFSQKAYAYVLLPVLSVAVLSSSSFCKGDSAEEFCLPLLSASLFYLLRYMKKKERSPMSYLTVMFQGILAGCVLWIKYTMLGFWFAWMMMVFLDTLRQKQIKRAFFSCIMFLLGMILTAVPWVVYFACNHALYDFINAYFYVNIFGYSHPMGVPSQAGIYAGHAVPGVCQEPIIFSSCGSGGNLFCEFQTNASRSYGKDLRDCMFFVPHCGCLWRGLCVSLLFSDFCPVRFLGIFTSDPFPCT